MGENYTRKTENYTARQNRQQNASTVTTAKMMTFKCWRCDKSFELPSDKCKSDAVWCPTCHMIHGQITHSKDA